MDDMLEPFLKWAGGKRWLIERHPQILSLSFDRYIEPFLGGGAMFFAIRPEKSILGDANKNLINAYIQVRDNFSLIEELLRAYQKKHSEDFYYLERSKKYDDPIRSAAQFIYLNRTCWNGLYRVNLNGEFNVPIGTKSHVFGGDESLQKFAETLRDADIRRADFEVLVSYAEDGDFLFVDPPYTTAHNFNGFIKYNENLFSWSDQLRLRDALVRASKRGAKILLTNAAHSSIADLYNGIAGVNQIDRACVISGKSSGRSRVGEFLITMNIEGMC